MAAIGPSLEAAPRPDLTWTYVVTSEATVSAVRAVVWIRVTEPIVVQPEESILRPWILAVDIAGTSYAASSIPFGPVVQPGDYELSADFDLGRGGLRLKQGDAVSLAVGTTAVAPQSQRILVLADAVEFPSRFELDGLREPALRGTAL